MNHTNLCRLKSFKQQLTGEVQADVPGCCNGTSAKEEEYYHMISKDLDICDWCHNAGQQLGNKKRSSK